MKAFRSLTLLALGALLIAGCSNADAPAGPGDDNAVPDALAKMSKEEKIKFYQNSPLPPAEKAAKLKELGVDASAPTSASGAGVPQTP